MMSCAFVAMQFGLIGIVLMFTSVFSVAGDAWQWIARVDLGLVLLAKSRREERGLALAHPGHADYRARTRAILPFVL